MRRRTFFQWWHESGPGRLTREDWQDIACVFALGAFLFFALILVSVFQG